MKQIAELLETGLLEPFSPEKKMTVADLLKELKLGGKYFAILVNNKKAEPDKVITPDDKVVILPVIKGG